MAFFDYIKNIFLLLIFLLFAPGLVEGIRTQYGLFMTQKTRVGIIKIRGDLDHSARLFKQMYTLFSDNTVKAILLNIESCGGAAGTGQALALEILTLKKRYPKPIITLTENVCTSGAYYIASATDYIISSGQALIGSIGSRLPHLFQFNSVLEKYDIGYTSIKAGTYKGTTDPFLSIDQAGKEQLQSIVNDSYEQFVQDVAHNRKLALQNAEQWADGKIFTGRQAKELNLIDEIGASSQAIAYIKDKQLIEGDIDWVAVEPETSFLQRLISSDDEDCGLLNSSSNTVSNLIKKICLRSPQARLE